MTGVPVISVSAQAFGSSLFEGDRLSPWVAATPLAARSWLRRTLDRPLDFAWDTNTSPRQESDYIRQQAIDTFGMDTVGPQWLAFLGVSAMSVMQAAAERVNREGAKLVERVVERMSDAL